MAPVFRNQDQLSWVVLPESLRNQAVGQGINHLKISLGLNVSIEA